MYTPVIGSPCNHEQVFQIDLPEVAPGRTNLAGYLRRCVLAIGQKTMRNPIRALADNTSSNSVAARMRRRRFDFFLQLFERMPKPLRILDIGGTQKFWQNMDFRPSSDVSLVLLNLSKQDISLPGFSTVAGDATDLKDFRDGEFDIVFSNSVIEHVGDQTQQMRMAQEVQRVGVRYFVQTPNYYFPIEPHFLFPGFQWLPITLRVWLVQRFNLGWMRKIPDKEQARACVQGIRLLTRRELQNLFPSAQIYEEKVVNLTKSFIAYEGWKSLSEEGPLKDE